MSIQIWRPVSETEIDAVPLLCDMTGLTAVLVKIQGFKNVYAIRLVNSYRRFGNITLLPNVYNRLIIAKVQYHIVCLFLARQPPVGQGLLIHEVSRSHTTHHNR